MINALTAKRNFSTDFIFCNRRATLETRLAVIQNSHCRPCSKRFPPPITMADVHIKCRYPNEYVYKRHEDGKIIRYVLKEGSDKIWQRQFLSFVGVWY